MSFTVKFVLDNQTRRARINNDAPLNYASLLQTVASLFPKVQDQLTTSEARGLEKGIAKGVDEKVSISWMDEENDTVLVSSDPEVKEALRAMREDQGKSLVRFNVTLAPNLSTPMTATEETKKTKTRKRALTAVTPGTPVETTKKKRATSPESELSEPSSSAAAMAAPKKKKTRSIEASMLQLSVSNVSHRGRRRGGNAATPKPAGKSRAVPSIATAGRAKAKARSTATVRSIAASSGHRSVRTPKRQYNRSQSPKSGKDTKSTKKRAAVSVSPQTPSTSTPLSHTAPSPSSTQQQETVDTAAATATPTPAATLPTASAASTPVPTHALIPSKYNLRTNNNNDNNNNNVTPNKKEGKKKRKTVSTAPERTAKRPRGRPPRQVA